MHILMFCIPFQQVGQGTRRNMYVLFCYCEKLEHRAEFAKFFFYNAPLMSFKNVR